MIIILLLILAAIAVSIFGSTTPVDPTIGQATPTPTPEESHQPRVYTVSYRAGVFSPTNLRIHSGDTVRFKNDGILSIRVKSDPPDNLVGFDSIGDIPQGANFAFTFAAKGIFGYNNTKNASEKGTIIVR